MVATRFALVGALAGAAQATWANTTSVHYTTEVVTELTTYCPAPTTLTHGDKTYTVTEPTTLTITDCPCTISKPVEPTPTHPPTPPMDECAEKCTKEYDECRVAPDANMATCAAYYAKCLNFNPFENFNTTVTACSAPPVYTTEVVTHLTTYCPAPTTLTFDHSTYTVTEPTTLTISDCSCTVSRPIETEPVPTKPIETQPVPTKPAGDCPEECTAEFNKCRIAPGSNKSTCAANYAGCLGFNPFANNGTLVTPTACSHGSEPTGTNPPTNEPTTPGQPAGDCPEECTKAYRECQTAPDANQSHCASQIASCLGYNPFEGGSFVTPTACSAQPPNTAQPPKTTLQPEPSATTPGAPGSPESPSSVPTGAADHLSPIKALGVIAALAML